MSADALDHDQGATPRNVKRRRLNGFATPATLKKPFRSPFRTAQPSKPAAAAVNQQQHLGTSIDASAVDLKEQGTQSEATSRRESNPTRLNARNPLRSYHSSPLLRQSALPQSEDNTDPETGAAITVAQRTQTALITHIAQVRQDVNALTQAISLASGTKDDALNALIDRWTSAAREAAEEVFSLTKDKVNKMGGVGAWREREHEQREWQKQWDDPHGGADMRDDATDDGDESEAADDIDAGVTDLGREERRAIKQARREMRAELRRDESPEHEPDEPDEREEKRQRILMRGDDDDTFTMDMMLTMLNIDLETIGYSKEHQMWVG